MRSIPLHIITLTAAAQICLMAATWPLWFSTTDFPKVAMLSAADGLSKICDQLLSTAMVVACGLLAIKQITGASFKLKKAASLVQVHSTSQLPPNRPDLSDRRSIDIILFCSVALVILDQHRLQPWHWLTMLIMVEFRLLNRGDFLKAVRITVATIYIFASLSRFGPDVASGMSGQVLKVILQAVNLEWIKPTDDRFFLLATAMNAGEFLVGFALLFRATQKAAVIAAVLLHFILILCLSPLGLNHHFAVLVWNTFLMLAVPMLFWATPSQQSGKLTSQLSGKGKLVIAVVVLIPASGMFGFADNWLSWQVYSPRPEVLKLTVHEDSVAFLPASLRPFLQSPQPLQSDCPIRLDLWSLHCKRVPIYPEDRFQIQIARFVVAEAVKNGAAKSAFQAEMKFPSRFPWWHRNTVQVPL